MLARAPARSLAPRPAAAVRRAPVALAPRRALPIGVDLVVGVIAVAVVADVAQVFRRKAERDRARRDGDGERDE